MKPLNQCWIKVWSQLSPELNRQIISQDNSSFYKLYTPVNNQIFAGILKQVRNQLVETVDRIRNKLRNMSYSKSVCRGRNDAIQHEVSLMMISQIDTFTHPSIRSRIYENTWVSTRFLGQLRDQINEIVQQNR